MLAWIISGMPDAPREWPYVGSFNYRIRHKDHERTRHILESLGRQFSAALALGSRGCLWAPRALLLPLPPTPFLAGLGQMIGCRTQSLLTRGQALAVIQRSAMTVRFAIL